MESNNHLGIDEKFAIAMVHHRCMERHMLTHCDVGGGGSLVDQSDNKVEKQQEDQEKSEKC